MPAVTVRLSTYPTITTQRLCCSGSAAGIVFAMYVTDPILQIVCDICMYYDGILFLLLQQAAAAAVIYTTSREDSSRTNLPQLVGGS